MPFRSESCGTWGDEVTFATRKANFDCWELEWTQCWMSQMGMYRWQVAQGRFFVHQCSGKLFRNAEFCAMKSIWVSCVDGWRTFSTNCEEIHNNLSKFHCRSHSAENGIEAMQALTRIGCLQAFESGPTVEEPCRAEMADYDRVCYDSVTGASLPSKLCEEAMHLEIKYMKEMNVYSPCEHGAMKEQGLTPIGDTLGLYERLLRRRRER